MLASRGLRNMDSGVEKVGDDAVAAQLRKQAMLVWVMSGVAALLIMIALLLVP
jgi:hypothetical protein